MSESGAVQRWAAARGCVDVERDDILVADLGGTSIKVGMLRAGRVDQASVTWPTPRIRRPDPAAALAHLLGAFCAQHAFRPTLIIATVPGLLDSDFDTVLHSLNVPELDGRAFASELSDRLALPVVLERDAVLQLLGEHAAGAARGVDHVLGIYFGTGIGAACLQDGVPLRGGGWALELGHRRARRAGIGAPIGCDRSATESLEDRAAGTRLRTIATRDGRDVATLFDGDTPLSDELLALVDDHALAIADCLAFLSPQRVVVGGGLVEMTGYPWARLRATLAAHAPIPRVFERTSVVRAELGWQGALHGALAEARAALSTPLSTSPSTGSSP